MNFPAPTAMTRLTPTREGQVTLRRGLLDHLGIRNGDAIDVVPLPGGRLEMRPAPRSAKGFQPLPAPGSGSRDAFFGSIKYDGPPISIEEMNEVIAKGWAGRARRLRLIVDTNVLVAASIPEHYPSSEAARRLIDSAEATIVPLVVLCEFFWVLRSRFGRPRGEIVASIEALLRLNTIVVDDAAVTAGLDFARAGGDFADGVIAYDGRRLGGDTFASFDARANKIAAAAGFAVVSAPDASPAG